MAIEFSLTSILNLSAIILIGMSTLYAARLINRLYTDEFAATMNWLLILVEAIFIVHLVIFFSAYFELAEDLFIMFVLFSTVFLAFLFFFGTYKIIHFLDMYTFDKGKLSKKSIKVLIKKKQEKQAP